MRSSIISTGAGNSPALRTLAISLASFTSAKPVTCVWPVGILSRITGAINTLSSSTIATCRLMLAPVKRLHLLVPSGLMERLTTHCPDASVPAVPMVARGSRIIPPDISGSADT